MRIGVFGGTFDPIHLGHLIVAEQCREQAGLDRVLFIPAARPPHKLDRQLTPWVHRLEMLHLAVAGHAVFQVDELEKDRPGPSFTVDTLALLRRRFPEATLHLLLGADCLPDLAHWFEPVRIVELARLLIVARPGWDVWSADQLRAALGLSHEHDLSLQIVHVPLIDIASRDVRARAREGRSVRYLVPRSVECYIEGHELYKGEEARTSP
jgi:nicotinate-nucleotide adenylyltransferase